MTESNVYATGVPQILLYVAHVYSLVHIVECVNQKRKNIVPRIVGGHPADVGQFPFQVAIVHDTEGLLCGGTIINAHWILTAAHCFERNLKGHHSVIAGTVDLRVGFSYRVSKIVIHRDYNGDTIDNDISMVKLESPIVFNNNVESIELSSEYIRGTIRCTAAGWGQISIYNDDPSTQLSYVTLKTITNAECKKLYMSYALKNIKDTTVCTVAVSGGTGTCYMDSGGPLVANGKQIGIISFGAKCGVYPDVFTRISSFYKWIHSTVRKYNSQ